MLVAIETAGAAVPGMGERTIIHCGPRIAWDRVCDPLRRSVRVRGPVEKVSPAEADAQKKAAKEIEDAAKNTEVPQE